MDSILKQQNILLRERLKKLQAITYNQIVCKELSSYKDWLANIFSQIERNIIRNLKTIDQTEALPGNKEFKRQASHKAILSDTKKIRRFILALDQKFLPPLFRYKENDRLGLKILDKVHNIHDQTMQSPFALSDGGISVYPTVKTPPIYYLSISEQDSLLYFPLFFHEFGHLLYSYHEEEMDDLVKEFQSKVRIELTAFSDSNDENSQYEQDKVYNIVDTWYLWLIEFYCDAVGLEIGGPSFLNAFSFYFQAGGPEEFYRNESSLKFSSHPVTYLRVKHLVKRAKSKGFEETATRIESEWEQIKGYQLYNEEYHGFYDEDIAELLDSTINDMLSEVNPQYLAYHDSDLAGILNEA